MDNTGSTRPSGVPGRGIDGQRSTPTGGQLPDSSTGTPQGGDEPSAERGGPGGGGQPEQPKGADLARAALAAAREVAKSKPRRRGVPRGTVAGGGSRARRRWSGAGSDDRDPQPLGRLASRIAAERGWHQNLSGGQVFGRWAQLVGPEVAERAKPIALKDGELTVQAESTAWATQLRLMQRQLLGRIAAGVGRDVVKRLRVLGPAAPSWRYGPRHVSGRGPRDTYG
ncbi:DciA family protein [Actinokineospora sp. G85]|uniref:DciA family protein n=1 Tax=Actinokineospora sp. G85 TaxID=3406626 RepID=UPI003C791F77